MEKYHCQLKEWIIREIGQMNFFENLGEFMENSWIEDEEEN